MQMGTQKRIEIFNSTERMRTNVSGKAHEPATTTKMQIQFKIATIRIHKLHRFIVQFCEPATIDSEKHFHVLRYVSIFGEIIERHVQTHCFFVCLLLLLFFQLSSSSIVLVVVIAIVVVLCALALLLPLKISFFWNFQARNYVRSRGRAKKSKMMGLDELILFVFVVVRRCCCFLQFFFLARFDFNASGTIL